MNPHRGATPPGLSTRSDGHLQSGTGFRPEFTEQTSPKPLSDQFSLGEKPLEAGPLWIVSVIA